MKSRTFCACLGIMMSISTFAMGEILDDGDWFGASRELFSSSGTEIATSISGTADGENTNGSAFGIGWHEEWTTERVQCEYDYYLYAWSEAHIFNYDYGSCLSRSTAYARVEGETADPYHGSYSDSEGSFAVVTQYTPDPKEDFEEAQGDYIYEGPYWHDPDDGISAENGASACGQVTEGSDAWTFSHTCCCAFCNLYQTYP